MPHRLTFCIYSNHVTLSLPKTLASPHDIDLIFSMHMVISPKPLANAYIYAISIGPRPSYIFSPWQRQYIGWVHKWYRNLILKHNWIWQYSLEAIYTMCQAINFWKVEQPSQFPYLIYTNLHGWPRLLKFSTCSEPWGAVPEPFTCYIYIDGSYIHVEVALGQNCQMYNKPAAWGGGLLYNSSSNERVHFEYLYCDTNQI